MSGTYMDGPGKYQASSHYPHEVFLDYFFGLQSKDHPLLLVYFIFYMWIAGKLQEHRTL